ncbi:Lysophospholipase L1 [Granulicella rosea]|uniref:Lysophospholipase L1 n=2 Tax=Granulicella rosea TaxID=474952 RepID=A0A239EHV5_9BACT|nr:Lysophospholipase L1 [Granulicella rosea]
MAATAFSKRGFLARITHLAACFALFAASSALAQTPHWVGSWMASPCAPADAEPRRDQLSLNGDTVRQIVHLSIGGVAVRLHFSNTFGTAPLLIRSVRVAAAGKGSEIAGDGDKAATFSGKPEVSIAPGESVVSDAVNLPANADGNLAVSFFVPEKVTAPAVHYTALQTSWVAPGEQTSAAELKGAHKITVDLILTAVDVASRTSPGAIVALGSSTTDGAHSTPNANHRWTDFLAERLRTTDAANAPAVLNAGISGNRVLNDGRGAWGPIFGESALKRFHRDVLAQSGLKWIFVFEGGNDIRQAAGNPEVIQPQQLIKAFQLMAREAHARKLKLIVATITPSQGTNPKDETPAWEATRLEVNKWILTTKDIDGAVDFDKAAADPQRPARLLPAYDSGDHLHPNDAGYKAMGESIDLHLFQ